MQAAMNGPRLIERNVRINSPCNANKPWPITWIQLGHAGF